VSGSLPGFAPHRHDLGWAERASAEWFDKIDEYVVLDVEDFKAQSSDDLISNKLYNKLNSVFNYGFGMDYFASEDLI